MRFSLIVVSCSLAVGLLGGCGGSTSGSGSSGPVPESQFEARLVSAVCDNIGSCCKNAGYAYDATACKAGAKKGTTVGSKYSTYNAQAAGACIDSIAQAMAACKGLEGFNVPACNQVFTGTQGAGQPCDNDIACAQPADAIVYCDTWSGGGGGGGQGTCVVEPRGKKGDACVDTCTGSPSNNTCSPAGGSGGSGGASGGGNAACYSSDGLYCGGDGTCDALIPIGQPCPYDDGCVDNAFCSGGTCAADKTIGSSCALYSDTCVDGAYCAAPPGGTSGTCEKLKAAGAACTDFEECQSYDCENGKCTSGISIVSPTLCSGQGGSGGSGGSGASGGVFNGTGGGFNGTGGVGGS